MIPPQKWYRKRFTTETPFSDLKGRGFHLDETGLWKPERVNRLVMVAAMAYVFTVFLEVEAIVSGPFRQLVRTDAFYHSLFQLGSVDPIFRGVRHVHVPNTAARRRAGSSNLDPLRLDLFGPSLERVSLLS